MISLFGYEIKEELSLNSNFVLYLAHPKNQDSTVLIKTTRSSTPGLREISQLQREREICDHLQGNCFMGVRGLEKDHHHHGLILEDFGGIPLDKMFFSRPADVSTFLEVALEIIRVLMEIHQQNILHLEVTPSNIFIHPETREIKFTGFGKGSFFSGSQSPGFMLPDEENLAYISPEQTGRVNSSLDYRSDYYSLGVVLYQLATGEVPFASRDPLELIHAHFTQLPIAPHKKNKDLPPGGSPILLKLLSKNMEDRYQSGYGLKWDMERVLEKWRAGEKNFSFPVGEKDHPGRFQKAQGLYGRARETGQILNLLKKTEEGEKNFLLISGEGGVGKTHLIEEIQRTSPFQKGFFIRGKFEQPQRNAPYRAFIEVFRGLIEATLKEGDQGFLAWKREISAALGANGKVLSRLVPELEILLGEQPEPPMVDSKAAEQRFYQTVLKFLGVFDRSFSPLVVFLDDLQGMDQGSLKLLDFLVLAPELGSTLFIGTYREKELASSPSLSEFVDKFKKEESICTHINLVVLGLGETLEIVKECLQNSEENYLDLAEGVLQKTQGNPFFVKEFLHRIWKDGILFFDITLGKWQWNSDKIREMDITENVINFMVKKIQKLSPPSQQVLMMASLLGNPFDLSTLRLVMEKDEDSLQAYLRETLEEGLLRPVEKSYFHHDKFFHFLHDRVQQAAHSLLSEEEERAGHQKVGKFLLRKLTPIEQEERLFEIADHLNWSPDLSSPAEREFLAQINFRAGLKAKDAQAYESAALYLSRSIQLLPEGGWKLDPQRAFYSHLYRAEAEYLNGSFDLAEELFELIPPRTENRLELAKLYTTQIALYTNMGKDWKVFELGQAGLKLFGIHLSKKPSILSLLALWALLEVRVWKKDPRQILSEPHAEDPEQKALMELVVSLMPSAYFLHLNLLLYLILKLSLLSLKKGNTSSSAFAYAFYGIILAALQGRPERGLQFGEMALELTGQFPQRSMKNRVYFLLGGFLNHWKNPLTEGTKTLFLGYQTSLEAGDQLYSGYNIGIYLLHRSFDGTHLEELSREVDRYLKLAKRIQYRDLANLMRVIERKARSLRGETDGPGSFSDGSWREEVDGRELEGAYDKVPLHTYYVAKMEVLYLYEKWDQVLEMAKKSQKMMITSLGLVQVVHHYFYHSLALTALYEKARWAQRAEGRWVLFRTLRKFKHWAHHSPSNFRSKYLILLGEKARIQGKISKALGLFQEATSQAQKEGLPGDSALAHTLLARLYLSQHLDLMARPHLKEACFDYRRWDAVGVAKFLEGQYASLLAEPSSPLEKSKGNAPRGLEHLDLQTVFKAAQAISGEIILKKLLSKLMALAMENAGAERGLLILNQRGHLSVEVEGKRGEISMVSRGLEEYWEAPLRVIHYAKNRGEKVVLADGFRDFQFREDPYIFQNRCRSLAVLPMIQEARMVGILYLENNLLPSCFTEEKVELLSLLVSQAAISIEKARLYRDMELAKEEILHKEQYFRSLIENGLDMICVLDKKGDFIFHSSSFHRVLGYTAEEMEKTNAFDLVHPEDLSSIKKTFEEILINPLTVRRVRHRGRHKKGSWKHIESIGQLVLLPGQDQMQVIVNSRDVTDQVKAEEGRQESEKQYRILVETFPNALLVEQENKITYINPEGLKLLGYQEVSQIGHLSLRELFFSPSEEGRDTFAQNTLMEGQIRNREGVLIDVDLICLHTTYRGSPAVQMVIRDIRETKNLREKTQKMERLAAVGQLSATIAHELRNPLGCLQMDFDYLVQQLDTPEPHQSTLKNIEEAFLRLKKIVDELLDYTRPLELELSEVDLHLVLESSLRYVARDLASGGIEVLKEYHPSPLKGEVDSQRMIQVFVNLFQNAQQAMQEGGKLIITTQKTDGGAEISIRDTGKGIEAENLEKIFTPFFTTRRKGTGLGLAVVSRIVEEHRGTIEIKSKPSEGTSVEIQMPLSAMED